MSRKRENRWELRKTKNLNKDFGFVLAMQPICKQSIKAYVGLLSLSFYCLETCIWLSLALLLGIDMELILLYNYRPWNVLLHLWKEPCRSLQETNRTFKKRTLPFTKQTIQFTKRTASFIKRTVPCKKRALIIYARTPWKWPKKRTGPYNIRLKWPLSLDEERLRSSLTILVQYFARFIFKIRD